MKRTPLVIGDLVARVPVIQGGMGVGVSLSNLAGAVAANGGVGVISTAQIGWREPDFHKHPFEANFRAIKSEIDKAREKAKGGIIAVNIMVATQRYEEYVTAAVKAGVDLIISGAGLPISLPKLVEGTKTKIAPIVSSVKSASVICRMWERKFKKIPDLVVIEGPEAGGHLGFSKEELADIEGLHYDQVIRDIIAYVKDHGKKHDVEIPVVVAGGIYDRADMDHALELGADGVQVGTRFVTTEECDASMAYKQTYLDAKKEDICIVQSPVGMPGRAIRNSFMERVKEERIPITACHRCIITCKPAEIPYCITDALVHAVEGDVDNGLLFCGSNAYRAEKIETVEEVMKEFGADS
ncbi:MAG: nitronate monooxygenase family protein [Lachnospiraceae bacterium]|nr:nitronate monooxygenase family protein [Lachnospiraceae bacterium]MDD3616487.1 nitronate monooxygenase family protein [Lachnospiraceae bacterium]